MREIEIKAQVQGLDGIKAALSNRNAELSDLITQHDVVWGLEGALSGTDVPWLRLRTETKGDKTRHLFTLKRAVTGQLDSIEHETEVSDPAAIEGIVKELGFALYSDITKTRQKVKLGEIEICLDRVKGLGDFIEAERLTSDDADYDAVVSELWSLLKGLGVDRGSEINEGYDVLINRKLGKG